MNPANPEKVVDKDDNVFSLYSLEVSAKANICGVETILCLLTDFHQQADGL